MTKGKEAKKKWAPHFEPLSKDSGLYMVCQSLAHAERSGEEARKKVPVATIIDMRKDKKPISKKLTAKDKRWLREAERSLASPEPEHAPAISIDVFRSLMLNVLAEMPDRKARNRKRGQGSRKGKRTKEGDSNENPARWPTAPLMS